MSEPLRPRSRRWQWTGLGLIATVIAIVTLTPSYPLEPGELTGCILCGQRWLADLLRNVILFVPLGAAVALVHGRDPARRAVLLASLFSALIELAQLGIPGRDPSVGDLGANTLGGILGAVAVRKLHGWTRPPARVAAWLAAGASILFGAVIAATGLLWRPSLPASTYHVQWTPDLEHLEPYQGRLVSASLGGQPMVPDERPSPALISVFLKGGSIGPAARSPRRSSMEMQVEAIAGPRPGTLAPLLALHDQHEREILLLGVDRGDLIFRFRTRASAMALDQPDIRIRSALRGVDDGDRLTIQVRSAGRGLYCLGSEVHASCAYGFSVGSGWAGLLFPRLRAGWAQRLVDGIWLAALAFPVGLWARRGALSAAALGIVGLSLGVIPALAGLQPVVPSEILSVAAGLGIGWLFALRMRLPAGGMPPA